MGGDGWGSSDLDTQEAGTADDTDKVADALANISFSAVSGKISFDASHNPIKPVTVIAVRGGKLVFSSQVVP
jgi:branched-chain amino acid transport system substrate-binding protein